MYTIRSSSETKQHKIDQNLEWVNQKKKKTKRLKFSHLEILMKLLEISTLSQRKKGSSNYKPESLRVMYTSQDSYLKNKGYKVSIIRGRSKFIWSNKISKGKAIYPWAQRQQNMSQYNRCSLVSEEDKKTMTCNPLNSSLV